MKRRQIDALVEAVLYEGHILYPYRPSARKNREAFTFGRIVPEIGARGGEGAEASAMQTECVVQPPADRPLRIEVGFLHPVAREVIAAGGESAGRVVPSLEIDGTPHASWHEAVERRIAVDFRPATQPCAEIPFAFAAARSVETLRNRAGEVAGETVRRSETLNGILRLSAEGLGGGYFRVGVEIRNLTPLPDADANDSGAVLLRTLASAHTLLWAEGARFLSNTAPPPGWEARVAACRNQGTWPVLVGDEKAGDCDTVLSSPIILPDYPQLAPESAGPLFDGTEIDEVLTLRILTMTDEEKREMRHAGEQARRLLERTEALSPERLLALHGALRRPAGIRAGDRVRIRPKARADVMDLALAGRRATVEAVEEDAEGRVHVAVVLDDDPGRDLGLRRQIGHRFFYGLDEVEPCAAPARRLLVAGIGNIFHGDDAFGVEALRALSAAGVPDGVMVRDFGIRSYDLALALTEGYDAVVFLDAAARGQAPGTLTLLELDPPVAAMAPAGGVDGHSLQLAAVLQHAATLGTPVRQLFLVGCEPATLEPEDDQMALSAPVQAAVPAAVDMVRSLLDRLLAAPLP